MKPMRMRTEDAVLIVVDEQPTFMAGIHEAERVFSRTEFILQIANLLAIPVLASEQNTSRMGPTAPSIARLLPVGTLPIQKMSFSCCGCDAFNQALKETQRRQVVIVGIETHICVSQTALDLLEQGFEVAVCPDALSARNVERHKLGMEGLRDSGILPIHTEAVAYEWMGTAENPLFREALKIVKEHA